MEERERESMRHPVIGRPGAHASFSYLDRLVTGSRITIHSFTSPNLQKYSFRPSVDGCMDGCIRVKTHPGIRRDSLPPLSLYLSLQAAMLPLLPLAAARERERQ